jgi:hypothetical protein
VPFVDDRERGRDAEEDPNRRVSRKATRFEQIDPYMAMDPKIDYARFVDSNAELSAFFADRSVWLEEWIAAER